MWPDDPQVPWFKWIRRNEINEEIWFIDHSLFVMSASLLFEFNWDPTEVCSWWIKTQNCLVDLKGTSHLQQKLLNDCTVGYHFGVHNYVVNLPPHLLCVGRCEWLMPVMILQVWERIWVLSVLHRAPKAFSTFSGQPYLHLLTESEFICTVFHVWHFLLWPPPLFLKYGHTVPLFALQDCL